MEYLLCGLGVARISKDNFRQEQKVSVNLTVIAISLAEENPMRRPWLCIAETFCIAGALK